ncbi:MAG TPA: hypothetical protein VF731_04185 [Solirubrobacterales bacterium]
MPGAPVNAEVRIGLRPIGNPMPLGFLALAAGTLTLSGLQLGWIPAGEGDAVALALVAFVFPLQLLASIFAFLGRDGAAAEGLGLLAGGWLTIGLVTLASPPGSTSNALGVFLLALAFVLLAPVLSAWPSKAVAAAVIGGAALRFLATAVYELSASGSWENVAGIVGVALFVLAAYAGLAMTLADANHGEGPLPLGRAEGGAPVGSDPTRKVEQEPGVRPQL